MISTQIAVIQNIDNPETQLTGHEVAEAYEESYNLLTKGNPDQKGIGMDFCATIPVMAEEFKGP